MCGIVTPGSAHSGHIHKSINPQSSALDSALFYLFYLSDPQVTGGARGETRTVREQELVLYLRRHGSGGRGPGVTREVRGSLSNCLPLAGDGILGLRLSQLSLLC